MQALWPSPKGCSGLWFICWGFGTSAATIMQLVLPPSGFVDLLDPQRCHGRAHGGMGTPSCCAAQCASVSPALSPSPPVTYSAVDFLSSGVLQCLDPHLDASPREICGGRATVEALACQDQGEWGWVSPTQGTGAHLCWAVAENPPLPPGSAGQ